MESPSLISLSAVLACLLLAYSGFGQQGWYQEASFGVTVNLNSGMPFQKKSLIGKSSKHRYPGFRVFANYNAQFSDNKHLLVSYGGTLTVYTRGLGNSMLIVNNDYQLDFTNSFSAGIAAERRIGHRKFLRTIGNSAAYNLTHDRQHYLGMTTNLVINSSGRNQILGSVSGSFRNLSLSYYNDGGPVINLLPISDNFDRYWTSGLHIHWHHRERPVNICELSFDQFTGYSPKLYELASLIGINVGEYTNDGKSPSKTNSTFNSCSYNLRINLGNGFSGNIGVLGSLMFEGENGWTYFGFQDIIHLGSKYALHENRDINKFVVGFNYTQQPWQK